MRIPTIVIAILMLVGLTGCFGNAELMQALANDNATACAKITTPWGGATYFRSNPVVGRASCDGMTIDYGGGGGVNVPVTVTPQVTIGAPTIK